MPTSIQPLDLLDAKRTVPSELRSAEWSRVEQWTRERSFFMAGVAKQEIAQEMRDIVRRAATGEAGEYELRKEWEEFLEAQNYQPTPGQGGTIKDLRSLRRFNLALRTNLALMDGWARKENGLRPGPLQASPAWELVRVSGAKAPRDWQRRFTQVGGVLTEGGRIIAPKTSEVWAALGSIANFDDAMNVDYPPLAWGSGMDWRSRGSAEVVRLGVMTQDEILAQADAARLRPVHSPNETLAARPLVTDEDLRAALEDDLAGFAEWETVAAQDRLVFTDPNGTRPGDVETIARRINAALPIDSRVGRPFPQLQRAALDAFAEDPEAFFADPDRDVYDDLARLFYRIPDGRDIFARLATDDIEEWSRRLAASRAWRAALDLTEAVARTAQLVRAVIDLFA